MSELAKYPQSQLPAPNYYVSPTVTQEYEQEGQSVPIAHYLWIIRRHLWKILTFMALCVVCTFVVSSRMTPIYESTATVDVDRQAPSALLGQESGRATLNDSDQFLATQVKLIQSDAVLRPVASKYGLLREEDQVSLQADPNRAQRAANAPVLLKRLKVTRPPNTYLLLINYRSKDPQLAADVANAIAQSYLQHTYTIHIRSSANMSSFMEQQLDELKAKMERSGQALSQFERELGVINPEEKTNILSARLLQLNTEYTTAQSDRVRREAIWNSVKSGSLESVEVSGQAEQLSQLNQKLNDARQRLAEVKTTYGAAHPEYRKANSQVTELSRQFQDARANITQRVQADYNQSLTREKMLQKAVGETKAEFDHINSRQFEYQQLKREAEADKKLYEELVRKIKEAGINSGFQNNNIRLADNARPALLPVFPNMKLNLALAFLFSGLLAVGATIVADMLDTTVRDPEEVSRYLGTEVVGILPAVKNMAQMDILAPKQLTGAESNGTEKESAKGYYRTISGYGEAVRTLRNTVLLSDFDARLRRILVTSAGPGEGKSTTAVHLALANAEQGKRTLLVDADLRRPSVHRKLGLASDTGLSEILTDKIAWRDAIQTLETRPNLFVLPAGPPSHRAADVIGPRIADLVDEWAKEFDYIILDSPPLLGFAEPLQMATAADGVLIVSRAGETNRKAVAGVVSALNRLRANVIGVVLNHVKRDTSGGYSYYYGYYRSRYYYGGSAS